MVKETMNPEETIWRRFVPIGDKEEMDRFETLAEEKNLSREDLMIILKAIKLNKNIRRV